MNDLLAALLGAIVGGLFLLAGAFFSTMLESARTRRERRAQVRAAAQIIALELQTVNETLIAPVSRAKGSAIFKCMRSPFNLEKVFPLYFAHAQSLADVPERLSHSLIRAYSIDNPHLPTYSRVNLPCDNYSEKDQRPAGEGNRPNLK